LGTRFARSNRLRVTKSQRAFLSHSNSRGPISRKLSQSPWWVLVPAGLILVACLWIAVNVAIANPWHTVALLSIIAASIALGLLGRKFSRVRRFIAAGLEVSLRGYLTLLLWLVFAGLPPIVFLLLSRLVADVPTPVAIGLLVVWTLCLGTLIWLIFEEPRRRRSWETLASVDRVLPFLYAYVVAQVAILLFGTVAFLLSEWRAIEFSIEPSGPGKTADFFAWHLLDSIPGASITKTLRWKEPLGYTGADVGVLLLLFKLVVIAPVIAAFVAFWRYTRPEPKVAVESTGGAPDSA
jgi:hypothetical protein